MVQGTQAEGWSVGWLLLYLPRDTVADFIFWGSKITADGDCSHKIKRHLLLGSTGMTNLDGVLKTETLLCSKDPSCQGYGFSSGHVWM